MLPAKPAATRSPWALIISRGSWWVFLERPICVGFLALCVFFLLLPGIRRDREEAFKEG